METPERTFELEAQYESLNKFLAGTMASIRRNEISVEKADAIAKLADKIVKNNLTMIMDRNRRNDKTEIEFFAPKEKQVLIG